MKSPIVFLRDHLARVWVSVEPDAEPKRKRGREPVVMPKKKAA